MIRFLLFGLCLLLFTACDPSSDDMPPEPPFVADFSKGTLVLNEGKFQSNGASLTFVPDDADLPIVTEAFQKVNEIDALGDVLQSAARLGDRLFLVLNNSAEVVVVDAESLEELGRIPVTGFPRYLVADTNGIGFLSVWETGAQNGRVVVLDLNNLGLIGTVNVGKGPEHLSIHDGMIWVANSGGFDNDQTVMAIDPIDRTVVETITVGDNPTHLHFAPNGDLWVLGRGYSDFVDPANDRPAFLTRLRTDAPDSTVTFAYGADNLVMDNVGSNLFFTAEGAVYRQRLYNDPNPENFLEEDFYGLGYDGKNHYVIGLDARDFNSAGRMLRYDTLGTLVDEHTVGLIPGEVYAPELR